MKLDCYVNICDRVFLCKRKSQRSILSLVKKQETREKEVYLLWQTRQHKQGTRYRIVNNVNHMHSRHIDEGKFTISFKEPPHNLLIQGDHILLKKFIHLVAHISKGNDISNKDWLREPPSFTFKTGSREVVVTDKSKYPTLQGFPRTTEKLYLCGLDRKSFDRQILMLQSLRILSLENNKISYLPKELGTLPHLEKLFLSGNCLGSSTSLTNKWAFTNKWAWMEQTAMSKNLKELHMSNNDIAVLPTQIGKLSALVHLKISQNLLFALPQVIGNLQNLRILDVSKNFLLFLPGLIRSMRLDCLDISSNTLQKSFPTPYIYNMAVPSLVDLAGRRVIQLRKSYDASVVPYTLVIYLDNAKYCFMCRRPFFTIYIKKFFILHVSSLKIAEIYRDIEYNEIAFECDFCSFQCFSLAQ